MKFRFKPEDFKSWTMYHPQMDMTGVMAHIANSVLEAHEKTLRRVLGVTEDDDWLEDRPANKSFPLKYTALLYDVEEIKEEEK